MKYFFIIVLLSISLNPFAQECSKELLAQKPGTWKAGMKGSINNVTPADLTKEKAVLASIHKLLSTQYTPKGCEVLYSNVFGKYLAAGNNWIADPYYYSMYILRYLCDKGSADKSKWYVDVATPTTVNISANVIQWFNALYAADMPGDDFRGYLKMKEMPQKKDGAYFMGEEIVGDYGLPSVIKEFRWLITYDDKLPFAYVTRKEYLLIQKKRLEQTMKQEPNSNYYNKFMNNIDQQLKKSDAELNKPAVCMWNDEERFEGFVEPNTKGSFIAVKPNPDYYNKKLPKSSPQFFTVVYKVSHGDAVFEENITAIKKAVDFSVLKNMLGK